ncbi:MAG: hypothetical protein RLZZ126_414 [Pseudomonadota bacterium]|jgi:soluble lytic murein transglycosylase-like protein
MTATGKWGTRLLQAVKSSAQGVFAISYNGVSMIGLIVLVVVATLVSQPDLRAQTERHLVQWLQARQAQLGLGDVAAEATQADPLDRATAANPGELPRAQAAVAFWLSKKYRVAPEPISALVAEAYSLGQHHRIEPTLILAVVAIESGFNPFAQSPVGAQGLMQVMTRVHRDKYDTYGGTLAAFDPLTNLRVGAMVLRECISRAGSIEAGLRHYVGAANTGEDGGYVSKVMAEHLRLQSVVGVAKAPAGGQRVTYLGS